MDEVECVLKRIQMFDPIGSGSRTPQECLLVQLRQFSDDTPWLTEARQLINEYSDLLSSKDYRTLMRKSRLKEDQLREAMRLLQTLNPRPGSALITKEPEYVIPDVSVNKKNGRWVVELNPDSLPKLSVNQQYAAMSRRSKNSSDSQFIRSHMQEAKWFIKSLESRNDTLMKVANCIVQQQMGFFEHGPEMMKPMVLNDVAEMVDMHESTISRVTTQKYMHTPRGIFELKYFFSSHVATESGGECSSTAIRALIKKLVAAETPSKPLSDSKIAQLLAEQGIKVARRTIAKYRESLSIPPSNQRKSLI
jgi:RNA polymerase sigma-54 factor